MKLVFSTEELRYAVASVAVAATYDISQPEFSTMLIRTSQLGGVEISTADSTMGVTATVNYLNDPVEPVDVRLPLRLFLGVLKACSSDTVELLVEEKVCKVKAKKLSVEVKRLLHSSFEPFEAAGESDKLLDTSFGNVKRWVNTSRWVVPKRVTSPAFGFLHLLQRNSSASFIASDVTSLVLLDTNKEIEDESKDVAGTSSPMDVALSPRLASAILSLPVADTDYVGFYLNDGGGILKVVAEKEETGQVFILYGATGSAAFPKHDKLVALPDPGYTVVVEKSELLEVVSRLNSIMAAEGAKFFRGRFSFGGGVCEIKSTSVDFDLSDEFGYMNDGFDIDAEFTSHLDTQKMEAALRNTASDSVRIVLSLENGKPVHVCDSLPTGESYHFVLMPLTG